jgi:hypothetical protein
VASRIYRPGIDTVGLVRYLTGMAINEGKKMSTTTTIGGPYSSDPKDTVLEYAPAAVRTAAYRLSKHPSWLVREDGRFDVRIGKTTYIIDREGIIAMYVVTTCHEGTDWCVREATAAEIADPDEEVMPLSEAREVAAKTATESNSNWFDFS